LLITILFGMYQLFQLEVFSWIVSTHRSGGKTPENIKNIKKI
jgi:hypothetical protein